MIIISSCIFASRNLKLFFNKVNFLILEKLGDYDFVKNRSRHSFYGYMVSAVNN